jgi:hypothetical protein
VTESVAEPHGLQFQIASLKAAEGIQVYQLRTPFAANDVPRFNIQGAQRFNPQAIQGAAGYFIQGVRWRVAYSNSASAKKVTPSSSSAPHPRITLSPFKGKGSNGKTVATPPKMKSSAKIAFGMDQVSSGNFFIDFQPRDDGKAARSLVWAKDGVLTVLVGGDSLSEDEIRRIADSFKPISRH